MYHVSVAKNPLTFAFSSTNKSMQISDVYYCVSDIRQTNGQFHTEGDFSFQCNVICWASLGLLAG